MRELENAIERAAALCDGNVIQAGDLPPRLLESVKTPSSAPEAQATANLPEVHGLRDAVGINNDDVAGQELCHILLIGKILHDAQDESAGRQPVRRTGPGKVKRVVMPRVAIGQYVIAGVQAAVKERDKLVGARALVEELVRPLHADRGRGTRKSLSPERRLDVCHQE